jgi:hypoxanthine phosphoribosyltransferase
LLFEKSATKIRTFCVFQTFYLKIVRLFKKTPPHQQEGEYLRTVRLTTNFRQMQIHDLTFQPLLNATQIHSRVQQLAAQLSDQYKNKCPLFISVLNGAFIFAADLIKSYSGPCEITFVKIQSYNGTSSSGNLQTVLGLEQSIEGRDVIILEDIVDSGKTLHFFIDSLQQQKPHSICTVSLLFKPEAIQFPVHLDYVGFEIANDFVVGYGLDYNGLGRNLPDLHVLAPN